MEVLCRAPWTSISLDPRGEVRVCCQNQWLRLGNVAESSLIDIWRGPELARLRERISVDDLHLGCDECRLPLERGVEGASYLHNFDHLVPIAEHDPPWPVQLELALSNTCNLQCIMCNGELSSAIRSQREHRAPLQSPYDETFFAELDEFLLRVESLNFLGGEPFLAREPLAVMGRLVDLGVRPQCSVTTNGTIWNDRVAELVSTLALEVAVSVDAYADTVLEEVRVGIEPGAFRSNVERFRDATSAGGGRLRLLFSLLRENHRQLGVVLQWADSLDVDVGVNRVEHPLRHSLVHGPLEELEQAVELMELDPVADHLDRNRQVWDRNLADLRALVAGRRSEGTPVTLRPVEAALPDGASGTFAARVEADGDQVVVRVRTTGVAPVELDLAQLVGESLWRLVDILTSRLGDLVHSDMLQPDDRSGERHVFVFESPSGRVELTAQVESVPDGSSCWTLQLDSPSGGTAREGVGTA